MSHSLHNISRLLLVLFIGIQASSMAIANEINLMMTHASSGGLYIHATLSNGIEVDENVETEMLLDTGSSYVALSKSTFNKIKENTEIKFSRYIYGAMADGRVEQVSLYLLDELRLADNCVLRKIEAAVLENATTDIIGLNALQLLQPFSLQMTPALLTTQSCSS